MSRRGKWRDERPDERPPPLPAEPEPAEDVGPAPVADVRPVVVQEVVVIRKHYWFDHPCPSCHPNRRCEGKVYKTLGRTQYIKGSQCRNTWKNTIPADVPIPKQSGNST